MRERNKRLLRSLASITLSPPYSSSGAVNCNRFLSSLPISSPHLTCMQSFTALSIIALLHLSIHLSIYRVFWVSHTLSPTSPPRLSLIMSLPSLIQFVAEIKITAEDTAGLCLCKTNTSPLEYRRPPPCDCCGAPSRGSYSFSPFQESPFRPLAAVVCLRHPSQQDASFIDSNND